MGSSLDLDKNKWVEVAVEEWVEKPSIVITETIHRDKEDTVNIGGCPNLVSEDCQTSSSVLLHSLIELSTGPAEQACREQ